MGENVDVQPSSVCYFAVVDQMGSWCDLLDKTIGFDTIWIFP